jgi:CheY-like chemotaxis protein
MYILLVDNDDAVRSLLTKALERARHQVTGACNGQEALNYLRQGQDLPQLILLDLMMPRLNGWQFLKDRKQEPRLAAVPVVVISSVELASSQFAPFGVAGYLQKPFTIPVLLETIAQFDV